MVCLAIPKKKNYEVAYSYGVSNTFKNGEPNKRSAPPFISSLDTLY